jgi:hypothetical protein
MVGRYLKQLDEEGALGDKKATSKPSKLNEGVIRLLEEDIKAPSMGCLQTERRISLCSLWG